MHLQDKAQLETAKSAKDTYAQAKIDEVILDESKNLKAQLASEIEIVRANYRLRLDYAFLRMADDDNRPMADSRVTRAANRLNDLGFTNDDEPGQGQNPRNQIENLKEYLKQQVRVENKRRTLRTRSNLVFQVTRRYLPDCNKELPTNLPLADDLSENARTIAEIHYKPYVKACTEALAEEDKYLQDGEIRSAFQDWQKALQRLDNIQATIASLSAEVAQAKAVHEQGVKQAGAEGSETQEKIQNAAAKLGAALDKAKDKVASLGILPKERIKALTTILLAVASKGEDDEIETENLDTAAVIAGQIPAIAGQIKAMHEDGQVPSVSALLIELQHQSILLDYAKEQQDLVRQRAALHEERYKAYEDEARQWLDFHDALCSYAVILAGGGHPGKDCVEFVVKQTKKNGAHKVVCTLKNRPLAGDCALAKSWKATLASVPNNKRAKREFYKALAAFALAMAARAPQDEYEYRLIDLDHQEVVATNRSAIKAWDNLVKVPLDQISAYHAAGIPPEKIAELLVTGMSLGAIAAGVNR